MYTLVYMCCYTMSILCSWRWYNIIRIFLTGTIYWLLLYMYVFVINDFIIFYVYCVLCIWILYVFSLLIWVNICNLCIYLLYTSYIRYLPVFFFFFWYGIWFLWNEFLRCFNLAELVIRCPAVYTLINVWCGNR